MASRGVERAGDRRRSRPDCREQGLISTGAGVATARPMRMILRIQVELQGVTAEQVFDFVLSEVVN